ncbi:MAG: NPCBM/NEW2 domain-containing protein [Acidobacteriota bacterium]|nr:NPCBM/NEW2 domain-containing protein [Acidobacteriota bacterium]
MKHFRSQFKHITSCLVLAMVCAPIMALAYQLANPEGYTVGLDPHGILAADFNNDGKTDLASANAAEATVSVLLGNGDGTFGPKVDYPVQTRPKFVRSGDFNGDGKLDIVSANEVSSTVTVLPGNGDGTFGTGITSPAGCNSPHEVAVADLNADGKLDLVVPCWNGTMISVLFGNGNGTFKPAVNYTTGAWPESAVIDDFNKDGILDVAIANYMQNTMTVLLGTGGGALAAPVPYAVGSNPHFVRTADLNKDGNLDLFTANDGSNNVSILFGTGKGTFSAAVNVAVGSSPESVGVGDLDGDGNLDLVTANSVSNNISVLLGTGTGSFSPAVNFPVGTEPFHVVVSQFDGDGKPDIAVGNYGSNNISVLLSTGISTVLPGTTYLSDRAFTSSTNGWGPVEKDLSNGENAAGDGHPITLNGTVYAKGLGVHAPADIQYSISNCSNFTTDIGVDDEVESNAAISSVIFQIWTDGVKQYDSGIMNGDTPAKRAAVNLTGKGVLELIVLPGVNNGNLFDHADWANAQITCSTGTTLPIVTSTSPVSGATAISVNTTVSATFSTAMQVASLTTNTVTLVQQSTATQVSATVGYNGTTKTATLTPSAALVAGALYTATVKGGAGGAKDSSGNPLAADFVWSFTTAGGGGGGGTTSYLSDLTWISAVGGWGPVEKDMSNGEQAAGDGHTINIGGVIYSKGIGTHANSDIRYPANGCTVFTSDVGVDNEVGANGSVVFQVWVDGVKQYDSGIVTGASAAKTATVSLTGANNELRLVVTDAGDGNGYDHSDWAGAKVTCGPDTIAPTVTGKFPAPGATSIPANTIVKATFSEGIQPGTLNTSTVTLVQQGTTTAVPATVSYDPTTYTVTLTPTSALASGSVYTATVTGGAKDIAGNPVAPNAVWTFTTVAAGSVNYFLSDLNWTSATTGWGPVEKDMSNGEEAAGDGKTITIRGVTYAKGLGAHAPSDIHYAVAGCTAFSSDVGVDDEVGGLGSVVFQVWADGVKKFDSGVVTGASAKVTANIPLSGNVDLELVITDAGDGNAFDHSDWAGAKVTCGS